MFSTKLFGKNEHLELSFEKKRNILLLVSILVKTVPNND